MRRNSKHSEVIQDNSKLLNILYDSQEQALFIESEISQRKKAIQAHYEKLGVISADEFSKHDKFVQ